MMKPTDEQLRDPKWWDESAPEGATHYDKADDSTPWTKFDGEQWFCRDESGWWKYHPDAREIESDFVKRPAKPAAPEWDGKGWPDVGVECEVKVEEWERCRVIGFDKPFMCVSREGAGYYAAMQEELRPIRTKEQRERDELQEIISDAYESGVGVIAAEIIAAGWTREKQDD